MIVITINDAKAHIILDDFELAKKLIQKNPACESMMQGNVTELLYDADELNTITSILKTKRKN